MRADVTGLQALSLCRAARRRRSGAASFSSRGEWGKCLDAIGLREVGVRLCVAGELRGGCDAVLLMNRGSPLG